MVVKLAVRNAGKRYDDLEALKGCSFDVADKTIVSIVGPSGCGKTTLLWSMSGLHSLTSGQVDLDGERITLAIRSSDGSARQVQARAVGDVLTGTVGEGPARPFSARRAR